MAAPPEHVPVFVNVSKRLALAGVPFWPLRSMNCQPLQQEVPRHVANEPRLPWAER